MTSKLPNTLRARGSYTPFDYGQAYGYRFGKVEVNFHAGELHKLGMRIRIQDQPLQVLSILLRHPGEIVTREEFRTLLWPADTFVDFDHGLTSAVRKLRYALDDDPERPQLIETVPRHGYRFIAPVVEMTSMPALSRNGILPERDAGIESAVESGEAGEDPKLNLDHATRPSKYANSRTWSVAVIVTCFLAGGFFIGVRARAALLRPIFASPPITLAVRPFRELGAASSHSQIADGMTQVVITNLGKLDPAEVVVTAKPSAETEKSSGEPASGSMVAEDYLLDGSTEMQGSHLRISVQLIKTSDHSYVWAESYDVTAHDVLHAQTEVATQIAGTLRQKLVH